MTDRMEVKTREELLLQVADLRVHLDEATDTLSAIRSGLVDAILVSGPEGEKVYTLRGASQVYRIFVDSMSEGALSLTESGTIFYCNRSFSEVIGMPVNELLDSSLSDLVAPADRNFYERIFTDGKTAGAKGELSLLSPEGALLPVHLSINPLELKGGGVTACAIVTDLKELKRHEEILASDRLSRSILDQASEAIVVCDSDGKVIRANEAAQTLCGKNPLLKPFHESFKLTYASGIGELNLSGPLAGEFLNGVEVVLNVDERTGHLLANAGPLKNRNQENIGCVVTLTDISEIRKSGEAVREALEALRRSETRYRLLSDMSSRLLNSTDPRSIINDLCRQVMGHLDCDVFFNFLVDEGSGRLQLNAFAGVSDEEAEKIQWLDYGVAVCGRVALGEAPIVAEDIFYNPDVRTDLVKSYGIQAYACHPLMAQGRLIGTLSFGTKSRARLLPDELALMRTVTDQVAVAMERMVFIRELRKSKEELEARVLERTAELEKRNLELQEFAFVASHDLQEPLRKIQVFGNMLEQKSTLLGPESRDYIERMQKAAARMQHLLESLLAYSRVTTIAAPSSRIDLKVAVQEALSNLEIVLEQTGAVVDAGDLPAIQADESQTIQLFQNLIANALKFQRENEPPRIKIYTRGSGTRNMCEICVEDNGIGFDQKYIDRIFTPFQRLHDRGAYEGVGMGLAICKKIVERHGGEITAESEPGKGSRFILTLPGTGKR